MTGYGLCVVIFSLGMAIVFRLRMNYYIKLLENQKEGVKQVLDMIYEGGELYKIDDGVYGVIENESDSDI